MKWEDIEKRFGDFVNSKEVTRTDNDSESLHGAKIWTEISYRMSSKRTIWAYWWTAASVIGTIIIFSLIHSSTIKQKNSEIARLESELIYMKDSENKLTGQVKQMQDKLDLAQSIIPENKNTQTRTEEKYINTSGSKLKNVYPATTIPDSIKNISLEDELNTEIYIAEVKEPVLSHSIMTDELIPSTTTSGRSVQYDTYEKGTVHYKIDYGDMKSNNETFQRSWKLTITYP
jgi:cell division protein FtsB